MASSRVVSLGVVEAYHGRRASCRWASSKRITVVSVQGDPVDTVGGRSTGQTGGEGGTVRPFETWGRGPKEASPIREDVSSSLNRPVDSRDSVRASIRFLTD